MTTKRLLLFRRNHKISAANGSKFEVLSTIFLIGLILSLMSCSGGKLAYQSNNLQIEKLGNNLYMHVSFLHTEEFGRVGCNGLIYMNAGEAVVFDTPVDNTGSAELIGWVEGKRKKEIAGVVVTHFHEDCLGGLEEFHNRGIASYSQVQTRALAVNRDALPQHVFDSVQRIPVGRSHVQAEFLGAGHTDDNIVGYIPTERALFGGCLVKALNAGKGNLEDADLNAWPTTVSRVKSAFPGLEIVVPGHGKPGGPELLDYTINLFSNP